MFTACAITDKQITTSTHHQGYITTLLEYWYDYDQPAPPNPFIPQPRGLSHQQAARRHIIAGRSWTVLLSFANHGPPTGTHDDVICKANQGAGSQLAKRTMGWKVSAFGLLSQGVKTR